MSKNKLSQTGPCHPYCGAKRLKVQYVRISSQNIQKALALCTVLYISFSYVLTLS